MKIFQNVHSNHLTSRIQVTMNQLSIISCVEDVSVDEVFKVVSKLLDKKDNQKECLQCGVFYIEETSECEFCGGNPTITKSKQKRDKKKAAAERKKEESVQKVVRIRRAYLQPGTEEYEGHQIKPIDYFHQIEALGFY